MVKPFQTENGAECQRDLMRCARGEGIDYDVPFDELPQADQDWVLYGETQRRARRGACGKTGCGTA